MKGKVANRDMAYPVCIVCGEYKNGLIWHHADGPWCPEHDPFRGSARRTIK